MNLGACSKLLAPTQPWLLRIAASYSEATDVLSSLQQEQNTEVAVRFLRGKKMATVQSMFDEFAAALQFPYYFGGNWAAFDECMADLAWLPATAYVLTIFDSAELLVSDAVQLDTLLDVLDRICVEWSTPVAKGEPWDHPAVPFHVLFHTTLEDVLRLSPRIRAIPKMV